MSVMYKPFFSTIRRYSFLIIFIIPGTIMIGFIIYYNINFQKETNGFTKAHIVYSEASVADSGKTIEYTLIDEKGKEVIITQKPSLKQSFSEPDAVNIFSERRVRFNSANPTKLYFENSWFGITIGMVFGAIFVFIGYTGFKAINVFKKPKRIIIPFIAISTLFLGLGLLADYAVSLEKNTEERFKYEYIGLFLLLAGCATLFFWIRIQKIWNEVDTLGNVLIIKDFNVIVNKKILASNNSIRPDLNNEIELNNTITGLPVTLQVSRDSGITINPFVIECKFIDENKKVHLFTTDKIWFNPTPFIKQELKVFVHPTRTKFYKIDTSFLPDVRFSFTDIEYRR